MPRVKRLDPDIVDHEVIIDVESAKVRDSMVVESAMDISGLRSRLFESPISETASVVTVCVGDENSSRLRNSPSCRRINHQGRI